MKGEINMTKTEIKKMLDGILGTKAENADEKPKAKTAKPKAKAKATPKKAVAKPKAELKKAKAEKPKAEPPKATKKPRRSREEITVNKIFKKIRKSAEKSANKLLKYDFVDGDGYLAILDGYRILRTMEKIEERNPLPENETPFEVQKIWAGVEDNTYLLKTPSADELKQGIKNAKAEWKAKGHKGKCKVAYQFKKGLVINAEFLLDAIEAVGNTEAYISTPIENVQRYIKPYRFATDNYDTQCIVLAINPDLSNDAENAYYCIA